LKEIRELPPWTSLLLMVLVELALVALFYGLVVFRGAP